MRSGHVKINRCLILMLWVIVGGYILWNTGVFSWNMIWEEITDMLVRQSAECYLPGMVYVAEDKNGNWKEWLEGKAAELIPLGTYLDEKSEWETEVEDAETIAKILAEQASDENAVDANGALIGEDDSAKTEGVGTGIDVSPEKMGDFNYLLSHFYTVDSSTMIRSDELNGTELMSKDLHINQETEGPKILIYHTHSQEMFADSVPGDPSTSIVGIGDYLTDRLNQTYHIETMHHTGVYDLINGELDRSKAYDLAKPEIAEILKNNPSIEVVIDLHRDGVGEGTHLVTEINGKPTAQIMFFNGLSKTRSNGEIDYLANPYIQDNLAFSLQMQVAASEKYPDFARRIYLRGYRYNMHLMPKSLLIEAGAQTNTVQEMKNAMDILAELLDQVLVK